MQKQPLVGISYVYLSSTRVVGVVVGALVTRTKDR